MKFHLFSHIFLVNMCSDAQATNLSVPDEEDFSTDITNHMLSAFGSRTGVVHLD